MKIDPKYYPTILLSAFFIGLIVAFLLGLRPQHQESGLIFPGYAIVAIFCEVM